MAKYQTGVVDALKDYGLTVRYVDGWRGRSNGSYSFSPKAFVCHHDAIAARWTYPPSILVHGRPDLPGPLCQFALQSNGTVWMVAAGSANHAGPGGWAGVSGNSNAWGCEAQNAGTGQPWPKAQIDAYAKLCKACCDYSGFGASKVCYHREWSSMGKIDPWGPWTGGGEWTRSGGHWRKKVAATRKGGGEKTQPTGEGVLIYGTNSKKKADTILLLPGGGYLSVAGQAWKGPQLGTPKKRLGPDKTKAAKQKADKALA